MSYCNFCGRYKEKCICEKKQDEIKKVISPKENNKASNAIKLK